MAEFKKSNMTHIGSILSDSLGTFKTRHGGKMSLIWDVWESAVGKSICKNAKPSAFKGSTLLISVTNSTWLQHLGFLKKDLLRQINTALGDDVVEEIKFQIGNI